MENVFFRTQVRPEDVHEVKKIVLSTGFFRTDELNVAMELVEDALLKKEESSYRFIFCETGGMVVGFTCYGQIPCTLGSYDLYWIVIHQQFRGKGMGKLLLGQTEEAVKALHGRQLFIETSSTAKYTATREFYLASKYREVARLPDFYLPGDDKIIFCKVLEE
jgi:N-acetylglutamate synthase-like GNAT family acetyltransferase